jgi:hypothetical protein
MLELVVNGVTKQSVQVPAIETGWGTLSRSAIQVFAAREGSDLDVAVAISDDFEFFPTYNSPENTLDAAANVRRSLGFDVPTQWHLFDPITDLGDTGQKKSAAVSLARKDSLDDQDASQGFVESVIYGYQISDTHNPGVPADTSKWCDTQDEEYVPPEALPNNEDPTWESISWVHTPCTRWNRVSRITQALDEPPYPASLSVRFPDSDIVLAYLTPDVRDVFGLGLLGNTIELLGQKDGQILSDNCFWYEDEPAVESETIRCNSVQVSAVLGVEVGRGMYAANQTFAPAAPCDDVYGVFGWRARLFLNIVAILEDKSSHAKSLYRGLIELSMNMNSKFMRGDEVRSFGRAVFDNAPVGLVRFSQDGFLRLFPESPSGDRPPTTISGRLDWLCYSDASANPPIDYEDPLFPWWRVRLI